MSIPKKKIFYLSKKILKKYITGIKSSVRLKTVKCQLNLLLNYFIRINININEEKIIKLNCLNGEKKLNVKVFSCK